MKPTLHKLLTQLSQAYPDTAFAVRFWDGTTQAYGAGPAAFTLTLRTPHAVRRALFDGALGFSEAYMQGDIEIDGDLHALFKFVNAPIYGGAQLSLAEQIKFLASVFLTRDTATTAKKNVARHYDLGNDFYKLWLDQSMTYTSAYFKSPMDTLDQAQYNKLEHLCRKLRLEPGLTLVDIGCGWGPLLFHAAENYGVIATGYTLSEEQYAYVNSEIERRGLQGRVTVHLQDYRSATGQFDRCSSIEMFEQVGQPFIGVYFDTVKRLLKPGGLGVMQVILSRKSLPNNPFIEKYIFPGGYLATLAEVTGAMQDRDLNPYDIEDLRLHYSETLDHWYSRFLQNRATVVQMFGEPFARMWTLYLVGCSVVFRYGMTRLYQFTFTNGLDNTMPRTRDYLYAEPAAVPAFNWPVYRTAE